MKSSNEPVPKTSVHSQRGQCAKRISILDAAAEVFCRQGFAGASIDEIVASSYRPQEADKVQGFHDIILFTAVALASFGSGKVLTAYGWDMLSAAVWPVTAFCLLLLISLFIAEKRRPV